MTKHMTMIEYYYDDDDIYGDRNKYGNDDDNDASGSGLDGPIFDLITTTRYHGRG